MEPLPGFDEMQVRRLEYAVMNMKGWLKFLGILNIVGGALYALTLVGLLIAWLPIWMGVLLVQAANRADRYLALRDPEAFVEMMEKFRTFWALLGILTLIGLVATAIAFFAAFSSMSWLSQQMMTL